MRNDEKAIVNRVETNQKKSDKSYEKEERKRE